MATATEVKGINAGVNLIHEDKLICTCGYSGTPQRWRVTACPSCGTDKIVNQEKPLNKAGKVRFDSILNVIEKDDRSFYIEKKDLYVYIDLDENTATAKVAKHFEMKWSLKDRKFEVKRNGKIVENEERYDSFFRGITHEEVLNLVATEGNRHLLKFAFNHLGKQDGERNEKLTRALTRLFDYPILDLFNFAGYGHLLPDIWTNRYWRNSDKTKPNEILGVPKYMMQFIKKLSSLSEWTLRSWKKMDEKYGGNNVKMMLEMIDDESEVRVLDRIEDDYNELHDKYGYTNHKRLMTYLTRDIKLQQGITRPEDGIRTLRDYVRMCTKMGINPEKYSKNLKKDHDIAAMNYRMMEDEAKKENFKKEMERPIWDEILYGNGSYAVVKPIDPNELIKEGETLGHCVASYVDDVIKGKCKILFLRLSSMPEDGLVTIEVRGEGNNLRIVQVKGRGNREPLPKEKEFIAEWAEKKKLTVAY